MIDRSVNRLPFAVANARARQAAFFAQTDDGEPLRRLFEHIPHLRFFAKDRAGRLIAVNDCFALRRSSLRAEHLLGRSDWQVHPPLIARRLRENDLRIMEGHGPHRFPAELLFQSTSGYLDWGKTIKLPMVDTAGDVLGILGISQPCPPPPPVQACLKPFQQAALKIVKERGRAVSAGEISASVGLPPRRLQSLVQDAYGVPIRELSLQARFVAALALLTDRSRSVGELAIEFGFTDQSSFTRHCRRLTGLAPKQIRRERWRCR